MKRVFYFSGFTLTVFQWHKDQFINSYIFDPTQEGLEDFARYLKTTENCPARILVDVIEEDFRRESIPHVNINDRKAVVRRLIERHYRKSVDYVYHRLRGREKSGRRDDKLFYGVLTNPEILKPWLEIIAQTGTAITGIWSLPMVSEQLLDLVDARQGNVLLVSQQVPSNLRQSFFKDGYFEISRSAVVNLDESTIGEYIAEEVEQTSRFLSNQRYIGFDDRLTIHVVCNRSDIVQIKSKCKDTPLRQYIYHDLKELHAKAGCEDVKESYSSGLYAYLARNLPFWKKHYGPAEIFRFYYQRLSATSLKAVSAFVIIISLLVALLFYSEARIVMNEIAVINKKSQQLKYKYAQELEKYEPELIKAQAMKSSALLTDKINSIKTVSPQAFLVAMSQVLATTRMKHVRVTAMEWQKTQSGRMPSTTGRRANQSKDSIASDAIYQHYAVIKGDVVITDQGLEQVVTEISDFVDRLKTSELIEQVDIIKIPLDIRSGSNFENEHSANESLQAGVNKNSFELRVLLRAGDHA